MNTNDDTPIPAYEPNFIRAMPAEILRELTAQSLTTASILGARATNMIVDSVNDSSPPTQGRPAPLTIPPWARGHTQDNEAPAPERVYRNEVPENERFTPVDAPTIYRDQLIPVFVRGWYKSLNMGKVKANGQNNAQVLERALGNLRLVLTRRREEAKSKAEFDAIVEACPKEITCIGMQLPYVLRNRLTNVRETRESIKHYLRDTRAVMAAIKLEKAPADPLHISTARKAVYSAALGTRLKLESVKIYDALKGPRPNMWFVYALLRNSRNEQIIIRIEYSGFTTVFINGTPHTLHGARIDAATENETEYHRLVRAAMNFINADDYRS